VSLINQMLQDLEKRRASGAERGALPNQVRVLPREEARSMPWWLIGIAVAAALIAALAWQFKTRMTSSSEALVAQAQKDSHAPALPLVPGGPASRLALDLEKAPPPLARKPAVSRLPTTAVIESGTPVKTEAKSAEVRPDLERPAAPLAATRNASATPAVQHVDIAPVKSAASARTVEVLPENKAQAVPANAQIDKRVQVLTPPQLAENEYREAANLLNQGRLAEAQEGFMRALQHNPGYTGARQSLAGLLLEAKKSGEAEQVLQDGLKYNPNQPGLARLLASIMVGRGDIADAIDIMQKSEAGALNNPDYLAFLGGLLQRQSRHREAVDHYQAALRLAPGSGVWLMGLGISLQALNRNIEAQDAFRRARSSSTLSPELQAFVDQRLKQLQ